MILFRLRPTISHSVTDAAESSSDADDTAGSTGERSSSASGYASPQHVRQEEEQESIGAHARLNGAAQDELWNEILGLDYGNVSVTHALRPGPLAQNVSDVLSKTMTVRDDFSLIAGSSAGTLPEAHLSAGLASQQATVTVPAARNLNVVRPGSKLQPAPPRPAIAPPPGRPSGKGIGIREPSPVHTTPSKMSANAADVANKPHTVTAPSASASPPSGNVASGCESAVSRVFISDKVQLDRGSDEDFHDLDETAEDKRLRRMRRNRESAAQSRNRKKQYVEELEAQVAGLQNVVRALKTENDKLRRDLSSVRREVLPQTTAVPPTMPPTPQAQLSAHELMQHDLPSLEEGMGLLEPESLTTDLFKSLPDPMPTSSGASLHDVAPHAAAMAGKKREASHQVGKPGKRISAASIAVMSLVTLVTFSVNFTASSPQRDPDDVLVASGKEGRMLMSIHSDTSWKTSEEMQAPLWPSLVHPKASLEDDVLHAVPPPPAAPPSYANKQERVIRAPHNSSWNDVLRIEAAERDLFEAQLALRQIRAAGKLASTLSIRPAIEHANMLADHAKALLAAPRNSAHHAPSSIPRMSVPATNGSAPVYEHIEEDETEYMPDEYEAQRFIFCSRAYMFDAAVRTRPPMRRTASELDMPASMPARFRHTAAYRASRDQLPLLSSGANATGSQVLKPPVVTLLLPSAALQGVVGGFDAAKPASTGASPTGTSSSSDLMQVQCQVLNASMYSSK